MAIDNPTIFCGDDTTDLEVQIVQICNVNLVEYFEDQRVLTRDKFQEHFDEILELIENWAPDYPEYNNIAYHVLGVFILELGAKLPRDLRERIVEATDWNIDKKINWPKKWIFLRKFYLSDLREKILDHQYGEKTRLVNLKLDKDAKLFNTCIGVEKLNSSSNLQTMRNITYINLDSCKLRDIPDLVYKMDWINALSIEANYIRQIPNEILNLKNLQKLYLRYNFIEEIPEFMRELKQLRTIDLSFNQIKLIPNYILEKGDKYYDLSLYNNPIMNCPREFQMVVKIDLSSLKEINYNRNKFNIKWYI